MPGARYTCPVCLRSITLLRGVMRPHYTPGPNAGPCKGMEFAPIELNNKGVLWMIAQLSQERREVQRAATNLMVSKPLQVADRLGRLRTLSPGTAGWQAHVETERARLMARCREIEATVAAYQEINIRFLECGSPLGKHWVPRPLPGIQTTKMAVDA